MIERVQINGLRVAIDRCLIFFKFNKSKSTIIIEEIILTSQFDRFIIQFNRFLKFFQGQTNISIISQKYLVIGFILNSLFIIELSFIDFLEAEKAVTSIIKIASSRIYLNGFIVLFNCFLVLPNSFVAICQDKVDLRSVGFFLYLQQNRFGFLNCLDIMTAIIEIMNFGELGFEPNF